MTTARRFASALASLTLLVVAAPLGAAPASTEAWHVVRPGDTLESLAAYYLGDAKAWPELHRLNPEMIQDPHWIFPGRRIRVRVERPSARANAEVVQVARRVEARPSPVPWRPADAGDLLLERDGIRTYANASAQLLFDDGTAATLGENSLVFIRRQTPARAPEPRKEIEIQQGQAELAHRPTAGLRSPEIEVVVSQARARTVPEADGSLRVRTRRGDAGAQFMVYGGQGRVSAGGRSVDLPAGTGSTVAAQGPPTPAEPLLAAPRLVEPEDGGELGRDEPAVVWDAVAGAASYVVELCLDADCGAVVDRQAGSSATFARFAEMPATGVAFVRVTAVAPSGLDGYPSPAARVSVVDSVRPPVPALALFDASGAELAGRRCVAAVPELRVRALDRRGQPLAWTLALDGADHDRDAFASLAVSGPHEVAVVAADERGATSRSEPAAFLLDLAPPVVALPAVMGLPRPPLDEPKPSRWRRRAETNESAIDACRTGLEVAGPDGVWRPIACAPATATEIDLDGESARLRLRAASGALEVGEFVMIPAGAELDVDTSDAGCGLTAATVSLGPSPHRRARGRALLEIEVRDAAGRTTRASWHVGSGVR